MQTHPFPHWAYFSSFAAFSPAFLFCSSLSESKSLLLPLLSRNTVWALRDSSSNGRKIDIKLKIWMRTASFNFTRPGQCTGHVDDMRWKVLRRKSILKEKSWANLLMAGCFFLCVGSPPSLSLKLLRKPDLPSHQRASLDPEKKTVKMAWVWLGVAYTQQFEANQISYYSFELLFEHNLLTWPGLRGGDKSSSESFPPRGRLLGGDWSESEPRLVFERLLGGDWSGSEASPFSGLFRGGDWSESESCLFWALFASGDRRGSGERFLLDDDELGFLLAGDESDKEIVNYLVKCL